MVSLKVTLAVPQLSEAVRVSAIGTASHSTITSAGSVSLNVGVFVSCMVKVAEVVVVNPQASVAVKVTVAAPVSPQSSLKLEKSLDQVTVPQLSEAMAPALLANQLFSSVMLPLPSHSTLRSEAVVVIIGFVVS